MNKEDPEEYIRDLERGVGQTPGAASQHSSAGSGSPFSGRFGSVAKLASTRRGRLILACAVVAVFAIGFFLVDYAGKTKVHGDLIMINTGAKDTIDCNNGNLKLDGSNNTYAVTGHCRRLEVFGGANHVTVDSADTISVFGDDNVVAYHSGAPTINKTGNNNIVTQRLSSR
jgi:Protein of unknown function (DUF3060)